MPPSAPPRVPVFEVTTLTAWGASTALGSLCAYRLGCYLWQRYLAGWWQRRRLRALLRQSHRRIKVSDEDDCESVLTDSAAPHATPPAATLASDAHDALDETVCDTAVRPVF